MNIKQLKEIMADFPDDYEIVLAKDGEGNSYSPLSSAEEGAYEASRTRTWDGEVWPTPEQLVHAGEDPEDYPENLSEFPRVLVLWPAN